jgi:hypothetical protein
MGSDPSVANLDSLHASGYISPYLNKPDNAFLLRLIAIFRVTRPALVAFALAGKRPVSKPRNGRKRSRHNRDNYDCFHLRTSKQTNKHYPLKSD